MGRKKRSRKQAKLVELKRLFWMHGYYAGRIEQVQGREVPTTLSAGSQQ